MYHLNSGANAIDMVYAKRNELVHKGVKEGALQVTRKLVSRIRRVPVDTWKKKAEEAQTSPWRPPPPRFIKVNVNAAVRDDYSATVAVLRNFNGDVCCMPE